MAHADWLATLLATSPCEIYIVDCASLAVIDCNPAARANMRLDPAASMSLAPRLRLSELFGRGVDAIRMLLRGCDVAGRDGQFPLLEHETMLRRPDGTVYPAALRIRRCEHAGPVNALHGRDDDTADLPIYLILGQDLTDRRDTEQALRQSDARFRAIVSNTPGLVYQFVRQADGRIAFPYLSEGCHALLGIGAEALQQDASRFLALVLAEDRAPYLDAMATSAAGKTAWNWEGRIWIEEWKDTKWINLRATPRDLADGGVQWEGIMTNITQSKLEEAEVKRSRAQLAELSAHVESVKEQERTRIAREIHDDLGGNLTAIKMSLALLARRLPPDAQLGEKAAYLDDLVDRTIESVHRISGDLRPGILDFGLLAAIEWQAGEFEKQNGIACSVHSNRKEIRLHPDQATALFRIFQEALTNISKHARATEVRVELARGTRNVRLQIADNGVGIASADRLKPKSFGIRGMVERASALGGVLAVARGADGGSVVTVRVPVSTSASAASSALSPSPALFATPAALAQSPAAPSHAGEPMKATR